MKRSIIELSEEQRMQLEMIVLDSDKEDALFFAQALLEQIKDSAKSGMKNHLDK